ncbi:amidase signature domain-containing protein [Rhexocercosporidium sp. MPI-PUGE-AT-0058]|nr:amidase signature domain-containing protein [Rhexocercosporidium sp. MPI-PUGE-AT-0058]
MDPSTAPLDQKVSSIIQIAGFKYFKGEAVGSVASIVSASSIFRKDSDPVPVTVIDITELTSVNAAVIESISKAKISIFLSQDDVIHESFTKNLLFKTASHTKVSWESDNINTDPPHVQSDFPCEGPYFLIGTTLYKVFKLYPDVYNAFMYGILQSGDSSSFEKSPVEGYIPVPSRLHHNKDDIRKPLSGKRIAVKDIYNIQGLATGVSSQAYVRLNKPATKTARCIQDLLDLGAVIVGKAKTVQFASGMTAGDWTESPCPTNPRGDQQLDPGCSSAGSAVSIAGYRWLDYAVGSDSLGSMTGPAVNCGIFGIRPSTGILSNDGGLPVSTHLDTPGCFARSIADLSLVTSRWLRGQSINRTDIPSHLKPTRILLFEEAIQISIRTQLDAFGGFLAELEQHSGVKSTTFSVADLWKSKHPPKTSSSVEKYLATTVAHIQLYDSYHNNLRFRTDYMAAFDEKPSVDPMVQFKWDLASKLTDDQYKDACQEKKIIKEFLEKEVFTDRTIMVLPGGYPGPSYRDEVSRTDEQRMKWQGYGLQHTTYSVLGGLPAVVLPVGERTYKSKFSGKVEKQPISVMIVGPRGSDNWLVGCLEKVWKESGRPSSVKVGTSMF